MKPVRSRINQFLGVNPHLHSYWQSEGGWSEFHSRHIVHLADTLKPLLLPIGYTAAIESSLQLRRIDETEPVTVPESNVSIYDLLPQRTPQTVISSPGVIPHEVVLPILDTILPDQISKKDYKAVKIYELKSHKPEQGKPVAWIELLSPSNKPGGRDAGEYVDKRLKIIENNIVYIEIDYLHESPATLRGFPIYRPRRNQPSEKDAHPYRVLIIDPRPDLMKGTLLLFEFDVDTSIPTLSIPLNAGDQISFDFGVPYRKTFEESLFGLELVDYRQLPQNFDRYSPIDQARIANRMFAVLQAALAGLDLEKGPFECEPNDLETALRKIERVGSLV